MTTKRKDGAAVPTTGRPTPQSSWTYEDWIRAGYVLWTYGEFAAVTGRPVQTWRKAMARRKDRIETEGQPRWEDLPEPTVFRFKPPRQAPYWERDAWLEWARPRRVPLRGVYAESPGQLQRAA